MKHIFIIGCKGIPAHYGGFETFVDALVSRQKSNNIRYHVACLGSEKNLKKNYQYHKAHCYVIPSRPIGSARAVLYDLEALHYAFAYCRKKNIKEPIFYVLACRIGPFMGYIKKRIESLNGKIYVNPDGHEWKRAKWNSLIKKYWKYSEKGMVRNADLLICDSRAIEKYIKQEYRKYQPHTRYLSYGTTLTPSRILDDSAKLADWYGKWGLKPEEYYLIVGRFVPENNYETMFREFMKSDTKKKLAVISNVDQGAFYQELLEKTHFTVDKRIVLCGTVYEEQLLKKIREQAYGYLHGHEVGGTNPSLLEALGSTKLNLLLDVAFNKEVGLEAALYWTKEPGSLRDCIHKAEHMSAQARNTLGEAAKKRIMAGYSLDGIIETYEKLWEAN